MATDNKKQAAKSADYKSEMILIGTYKGKQLDTWPGLYNYPLRADSIGECEAARINELWLFNGTKPQRTFRARFLGVKTRKELVEDYGYAGKGKPHASRYLLFRTREIRNPKNGRGKRILLRLLDFRESKEVMNRLKKWRDTGICEEGGATILKVLKKVPPEECCVCETALQLSLFDTVWNVMAKTPPKQTPKAPAPSSLCKPIALYSKELKRKLAALFEAAKAKADHGAVRVLELFAGVGGFRIGLERASSRYVTVWNNQWEPATKRQDASLVYCRRFGEEGHSNVDIADVPAGKIPEADLLVGGFPCQDYSVANTLKRAGGIEGKKGVLWWQIHRILRDSPNPPNYLFLENVDRLLKSPASQRGRDFAIILASLSDLGYSVEWRVINAADYGMPQRRRRTYIVAYRNGTPLAAEAAAAVAQDAGKWLTETGVIAAAFESRPEIPGVRSFRLQGDLVEITNNFNVGEGKSPFEDAGVMVNRQVWTEGVESTYKGPVVTLGELIVDEKDVPEEFFIEGPALDEWKYLKGPKSEERVTPEGFRYHYTEGGMAFPDALDKPSRTIITGEGGVSPSRFKHVILTPSGRYRRLTPVELERLNMFPDNHTEGASAGRRAFLMGNALVTGIIERVGISLLGRIE